MNDPRFHLSKENDHNFKDPYPQIGSRSIPNEISCSNTFIDQEFVQFRPNSETPNDDSGACSPPLWKSGPGTPSSEPLLSHHVYRNLSPASRLQAITRGQKELMEMVRSMPESSYELSLKDLVEHHRIEAHAPPSDLPPRVRRQESKKNNMARNGSLKLERKGLFLKMVFPFSLQPVKKRSNLDRSFSGRVSPVKGGGGGGGEGDWWRRKLGGSSGSDSSRISVNSGGGGGSSRSSSGRSSSGRSYGGGGRKGNGYTTGCWPFFRSKNSKSEE
ncbi:uncharacterized protein LOC131003377 [Salvia miltiorrhiza]|uniref:uncharacterized protein LOC131003377 n=1 Tax=Salvia miltiorrhiza TaxID=226208 RepID=UPI0025AC871E|nr:uncharacterized protein LOC131003377 [Salvia miltiorrhiza]